MGTYELKTKSEYGVIRGTMFYNEKIAFSARIIDKGLLKLKLSDSPGNEMLFKKIKEIPDEISRYVNWGKAEDLKRRQYLNIKIVESLNKSKFHTLEKEQMKKIVGGYVQATTSSIWTVSSNQWPSSYDDKTSEDAPPTMSA